MIGLPDPFGTIPPPGDRCRLTVVIPARDEAGNIARTLEALVAQRDFADQALDPSAFDVLVYANNCNDGTATLARAVAQRHPQYALFVAEERLPHNVAHIGTARRAAMNAAAARFAAAGTHDAILVATDADTVAHPQWLAWTVHEMRQADAVMGRVLIDSAEWKALPPSIRTMLAQENAYHFAIARLAALIDPKAHDPWPRHWQRSGPSFAVRLAAYNRAGGVPPVRSLEDIALYDALVQSGARIRHSLRVRVTTSARLQSRAPGGFGSRMTAWRALGDEVRPLLVEDPAVTIARLQGADVGPAGHPPSVPATEATAIFRQVIARGVIDERATRSSVASIAG